MAGRGRSNPEKGHGFPRRVLVDKRQELVHGGRGRRPGQRGAKRQAVDDGNGFVGLQRGGEEVLQRRVVRFGRRRSADGEEEVRRPY